jgi:hypothetical protein
MPRKEILDRIQKYKKLNRTRYSFRYSAKGPHKAIAVSYSKW